MNTDIFIFFLPFVVICIISGFRTAYLLKKLDRLMMNKHTEEWKEQTTIPGLGPGFANPFRGLPFLFNNEDYGDKEVLTLKIKCRHSIIYTVTSALSVFAADTIYQYFNK